MASSRRGLAAARLSMIGFHAEEMRDAAEHAASTLLRTHPRAPQAREIADAHILSIHAAMDELGKLLVMLEHEPPR